jgi:hypothetical protein
MEAEKKKIRQEFERKEKQVEVRLQMCKFYLYTMIFGIFIKDSSPLKVALLYIMHGWPLDNAVRIEVLSAPD